MKIYCNHIGDVVKQIQNAFNKDYPGRYIVRKDRVGTIRIHDSLTHKSTIYEPDFEKVDVSSKKSIPWDKSYRIDDEGNVYDSTGYLIGEAFIRPVDNNSTRSDRRYKMSGKFNTNEVNIQHLEDVDTLVSKIRQKLSGG